MIWDFLDMVTWDVFSMVCPGKVQKFSITDLVFSAFTEVRAVQKRHWYIVLLNNENVDVANYESFIEP